MLLNVYLIAREIIKILIKRFTGNRGINNSKSAK